MTDRPLEITRRIDAEVETVFAWFTDPARYARWMGTDVTLDPSPGGTYRVFMREGREARGEFVEVDPPRRVVFTWGWVGDPLVPPGSTRVEVTLERDGEATLVRLAHHDLPSPDAADHHGQGWNLYLDRLVLVARGADPGPDPNAA